MIHLFKLSRWHMVDGRSCFFIPRRLVAEVEGIHASNMMNSFVAVIHLYRQKCCVLYDYYDEQEVLLSKLQHRKRAAWTNLSRFL